MKPDFTKLTIDTLAKRSAYLCSNPDCRLHTAGPNSDPTKAVVIGEAAHIVGARPKSSRYISNMTDSARAEITNAIWLCRNCHKRIDADEISFPKDLLFAWREMHEEYVLSELGTKSEQVRFNQREELLKPFKDFPHIIKRIVIDKPELWELRLTSELMRYLNQEPLKKIEDLRCGRYVNKIVHIDSDEAPYWLDRRLDEMTMMISPSEPLLKALNNSWGPVGEHGDEKEILHVCKRLKEYFFEVLRHEEQFYFSSLPEEYEQVLVLLRDRVASQVQKIDEIPNDLDEVVAQATQDKKKESPLSFDKTIEFDVPIGWAKQYNRARKRALAGKMPPSGLSGSLLRSEYSLWYLCYLSYGFSLLVEAVLRKIILD